MVNAQQFFIWEINVHIVILPYDNNLTTNVINYCVKVIFNLVHLFSLKQR